MKVLYILGVQRSGSTLIDMCLGAEQRCLSLGEVHMLDEYIASPCRNCTCGQHVKLCEFWSPVLRELGWLKADIRNEIETAMRLESYGRFMRLLRAGLLAIFPNQVGLGLAGVTGSRFRRLMANNMRVFAAIEKVHSPSVVVDSSKNGLRLLMLNAMYRNDLKVLYVQRDGRAIANSLKKHYGISIAEAAEEWKASQAKLEKVVQQIPKQRVLRLSYEQFCNDSLSTVRNILGFTVGSNWRDLSLSEEFRINKHNIHGSPSRLNSGDNKISLDASWKTQLSQSDLETFNRIGGVLNRALGYES